MLRRYSQSRNVLWFVRAVNPASSWLLFKSSVASPSRSSAQIPLGEDRLLKFRESLLSDRPRLATLLAPSESSPVPLGNANVAILSR
jgi:hypothetical protein